MKGGEVRNMKKVLLFLVVSLLTMSFVFAANGNQVTSNNQAGTVTKKAPLIPEPELTANMTPEIRYQKLSLYRLQLFHAELTDNGENIQVDLSNGEKANVKVMPITASETAIQKLSLKNCVAEEGCSIELKEVGKGNNIKAMYELKNEEKVKVLGIFKANKKVSAQIDPETGEVVATKKPWWSFLAFKEKTETLE
jgi:inner membrane protein involved in colicin E2 resistance